MNKTQLLALAAFITSLANEGEATNTPAETTGGGELPPPRKRGRPAAAAEPQTGPQETEKPVETVTGKTYEELQAIIRPLVEAGSGPDVKLVIAKYGENLKAVAGKPETHAAFEKDISALSY